MKYILKSVCPDPHTGIGTLCLCENGNVILEVTDTVEAVKALNLPILSPLEHYRLMIENKVDNE